MSLLLVFITTLCIRAEARDVRFLQLNLEQSPEVKEISLSQRLQLTEGLSRQWSSALSEVEMISASALNNALPSDFDPTSCGERCPLIIARAAQADLVSTGVINQRGQSWGIKISVTDVAQETVIFEEVIKAANLNSLPKALSVKVKDQLKMWNKLLTELSEQPLRIYQAEQATAAASGRWSELGIEWLPIKGGSFEMGHPLSHPSERPVHAVNVANFQMMKTEVTADQYWACVKAGVCSAIPEREGCVSLGPNAREAVNCVTWEQARTFSEWIGARLPTEIEWELAAKGREGRRYPWGDEPASCNRLSHTTKDGVEGCGDPSVQAPCSYPKGISPQGLCDLAGNLWEWVEDDWHRDYRSAPTRGAWCAPNTDLKRNCSPGPRTFKTYRGGSWYHTATRAQSTSRAGALHSVASVGVGFRCAL